MAVDIDFYGETETIFYHNSILEHPSYVFDESYYQFYYEQAESSILFEDCMENLKKIKTQRKLNDFLYYKLIHKAVDVILKKEKEPIRNLFKWFLLTKSGFNTRIVARGNDVTIHVYTHDLVYGSPQSRSKGGYWVDITSFHNDINYKKFKPLKSKFYPNKEGIPFSFALNEIPLVYEPKIIVKEIDYKYEGKPQTISVSVDKGYVNFLKKYPEVSLTLHGQAALSPTLTGSFIKELKNRVAGKSKQDAVRYLMSFTRTAFKYKNDLEPDDEDDENSEKEDDEEQLKRIIFFPEESLLETESDYEDRSVLLYSLIKNVVNEDPIFVKISKMTSVAVNFGDTIGRPIPHDSLIYALCEPTESIDTLEIGEFPKKYEHRYFKVFKQ